MTRKQALAHNEAAQKEHEKRIAAGRLSYISAMVVRVPKEDGRG